MQPVDLNTATEAQLKAALAAKKKNASAKRDAAKQEFETLKDTYIDTTFNRIEEHSRLLREFKTEAVKMGLELHGKMYEVYERTARSLDSYSLVNKEGTKRIVIERQHKCEYDERAEVAIGSIKDVLKEKFSGRNKGMYDIIDSLLLKNGKGDYDERMVAKLRKHEATVNDERFSQALQLLSDSYHPVATQLYIRAYRKEAATGKWVDIPINWSSM